MYNSTRIQHITLCLIAAIAMCSCSLFTRKHQSGAIVEVYNQYLYEHDLAAVTAGLHWEDSAIAAENFIRQWAIEILEAEEGRKIADDELKEMVKDYQTALYKYSYEQKLVNQRMPKDIEDSLVIRFYNEHPEEYVLKESLVKGILLTLPNDAPDLKKVRNWLAEPNEKNLEALEKYAYRNASGYELFLDEWRQEHQLTTLLPMENNDFTKLLKTKSQIELHDSISTYILHVTDKVLKGETMPIEYARPQIEAILLAERQVTYLHEERNKLYDEALRFKKIKRYDR